MGARPGRLAPFLVNTGGGTTIFGALLFWALDDIVEIILCFGRMVCRYEIWIGEMWDEVCAYCGSAYWEKGA